MSETLIGIKDGMSGRYRVLGLSVCIDHGAIAWVLLILRQSGGVASLLVVTGPPGAGKSTISAILATCSDRSVLIQGDRFFDFLAEGATEPWLPESRNQNEIVAEAAAMATGRFARDYQVVYDGVVYPWFLPAFTRAAGVDELDYVIILPPIDVCVRRVRSRAGHGFSDEAATRSMHTEFRASPKVRRHTLAGEMAPIEAVNAIRLAQANGQLRYSAGHTSHAYRPYVGCPARSAL